MYPHCCEGLSLRDSSHQQTLRPVTGQGQEPWPEWDRSLGFLLPLAGRWPRVGTLGIGLGLDRGALTEAKGEEEIKPQCKACLQSLLFPLIHSAKH